VIRGSVQTGPSAAASLALDPSWLDAPSSWPPSVAPDKGRVSVFAAEQPTNAKRDKLQAIERPSRRIFEYVMPLAAHRPNPA
jgi:hypothetical protein